MPEPRAFERDGVRIVYYDAGPATAAPPLVLCHGFPDMAFGWRNQIAALAARGFRVIALDQRGYGQSDCPDAVEAYDLDALTGDLCALLDVVGVEKAVFVGHDWGGIVVWSMPLRRPGRVAGIVALNTPYSKKAPEDPIAIFRRRFGSRFYIAQFNENHDSDRAFEADVARTLRFFFRRPEDLPPGVDGRASMDTVTALAAYDPAQDDRQFLTPDELGVYCSAFRRTGFTPGVNWYRNFTRNWLRAPRVEDRVAQPALMIMAGRDLALPPSACDGMEKYVVDLEKRLIADSGHWTQQEQPDAVAALIADWMIRRFGPDAAAGLAAGPGEP
jgi:pimeloyl-ACP methyl ester carboxylesterase